MKILVLLGTLLGVISLSSFTSVNEPSPASISPSLVFPVAHKKAYVGSFWGAVRDGGKRKHEGIDIFAKKGTPVVAVSDGVVVAVTNGGRGGKTVWLRSADYGWAEYYAHLNEQKVKRGQKVTKGQVIGTVGNTGNAKLTPPHLHFGIYTTRGAVNPFPYVKNSPRLSIPANTIKKEVLATASLSHAHR
jgi:murein DD-endopeptidase MepM/ murein hydrolase activator NlpD